jgi:hypothetical protein
MSTGSSSWIRKEKRLALYIRDEFTCCYCGRQLKGANPREVTLDHLVPRNAGGDNQPSNLVTACLSCNSSRQDKPWVDFATGGAVERIQTRRTQPINVPLARAIILGTAGDAAVEGER